MSEELAAARVARETDNAKVRPVDLLRAMAHDIETGQLDVDGLLLIYARRPDDNRWTFGSYRCGMSRDQELTALTMQQHSCIRKWREEE